MFGTVSRGRRISVSIAQKTYYVLLLFLNTYLSFYIFKDSISMIQLTDT